jgi:hypothetical protein
MPDSGNHLASAVSTLSRCRSNRITDLKCYNSFQGQHIGHRLDCPGEEIPPTVFMEIRFQGTLLDISDAIMAKSCKHKLRNILDRFRI